MSLLSKVRSLLGFANPNVPLETSTAPKTLTIDQEFQRQLHEKIASQFPDLKLVIELNTNRFLLTNGLLSLESSVFEKTQHPNAVVFGLSLRLSHKRFFATGIEDRLAGIGSTDSEALKAGAQNYIDSVFSVVMEALSPEHDPALDFRGADNELWHPILGNLQVQGIWAKQLDSLDGNRFFELLKPVLLPQLTPQYFHWLKLYTSRLPEGKFIGECFFDNSPCPEGEDLLRSDVASWPQEGSFAGQKQFFMLRKCGGLVD